MKYVFASILWLAGIACAVLFGLVPQFHMESIDLFNRFGFAFAGLACAGAFWILAAITYKS